MSEQRKPKRGAMIHLTFEGLISLLRLPEGTVFRGIRIPEDEHDTIDIKVWHDDLPVVPEGTAYKRIGLRETDDGLDWDLGDGEHE